MEKAPEYKGALLLSVRQLNGITFVKRRSKLWVRGYREVSAAPTPAAINFPGAKETPQFSKQHPFGNAWEEGF